LRVISKHQGQKEIIGDISEGEPIGEFSLFKDENRMASVVALRDSVLLELNRDRYREMVRKEPDLSISMTSLVIDRMTQNQFRKRQKAKPQYIAVISMDDNADISGWLNDLYKAIEQTREEMHHYTAQDFAPEAPDKLFSMVEQKEGMHFFQCDTQHMAWTKQCLLYCDLVLLVTPFSADQHIRAFEHDFELYEQGIFKKLVYMVLLHERDVAVPRGTEKWLTNRKIDLCLHCRKNFDKDMRRISRILTRNAVGLVLGGGGGKGFAHVGAVKALIEAGIEIDFMGGSSAGALYGLPLSYLDFDMEEAESMCKKSAEARLTKYDFQIPTISLMSGRKLKNFLKAFLRDVKIEDFWVNSFCVATDYSKAESHVLRSGTAWKQIAASIAIPGVFPPVIIDKHLHFDGGLMDNVPVGPMYDYPVREIIAISLSKHQEKELDLDEIPRGRALFFDKYLPGKKKYHLPGIASILMNALILNSHRRLEEQKDIISIHAELELKGVGMLDDSKWKALIDKGYEQMKVKIAEVPLQDRFWKTT
jgi:NTE family protein